MLSRVQRLLNFANNSGPDDEAPLGNLRISDDYASNGWNSMSSETDESSLFIQDSAGYIIIRQSNYPTASGGLGDVYMCTRKRLNDSHEVAVKCPRFANLSNTEVAKVDKSIDREVEIWDGLEHQYVLPFYSTVEGFGPFRAFVFPWMQNGNLSSYLDRTHASLAAMDRLKLLGQITEGLKYLHDNNVIHGDLSSNNVLIAIDGSPRLADFGTSNIIRQSDTTFSYHPGVIRWVAPEFMVLPEEYTMNYGTKSGDIYALGCIMLQVLYGKEPYWWIRNALFVISAKFKNQEPINSSIQLYPNHLDFMRRCWLADAQARPSVEEALNFVLALLHEGAVSSHSQAAESDSDLSNALEVKLQDLTKCISKIGEYPIASGGFGDIWKCIYQNDHRQTNVAVKSLRVYAPDEVSETSEQSLRENTLMKRLQRELKICARVQHENILGMLGYATGFGPYMAIVSPWADKGNLSTYLEREDASLSLVGRFKILRDVAAGLQYLHAHNIIHGDLTGPNVLIHDDRTACLADFGLSLVYSEAVSITQASWTSSFHGSVRWLAPERLEETQNDLPVRPNECSDIYSYGGIMLQVLTGKIPYYWLRRDPAVMRCVIVGEKPRRSRYRTVSDEYWDFIEECWSAVPDARPSSKKVLKVIRDEVESLSSSSADS